MRILWNRKVSGRGGWFTPSFSTYHSTEGAPVTWVNIGTPLAYLSASWPTSTLALLVWWKVFSGTLKSRIYNVTDSVAVSGTEISTTSTSKVLTRATGVTLTTGKTYQVQRGLDASSDGEIQSAVLAVEEV